MKKEEKKIEQIIRSVAGNVLVIGLWEERLITLLEENDKIVNCNMLNVISSKANEQKKIKQKRKFNIKSLRKKFHKKQVDYIICNMSDIYPYINTFVKDSIYINRKKLYFYGERKIYELDKMIKKYKKYHAKVEQKFEGDYFFITISNEISKTNKIKDLWFSICDFLKLLYDTIGDILIN